MSCTLNDENLLKYGLALMESAFESYLPAEEVAAGMLAYRKDVRNRTL
jgi:hypothetical protein